MKVSFAVVLVLLCIVGLAFANDSYAENLKNSLLRLKTQVEAQTSKLNLDFSSISNDLRRVQQKVTESEKRMRQNMDLQQVIPPCNYAALQSDYNQFLDQLAAMQDVSKTYSELVSQATATKVWLDNYFDNDLNNYNLCYARALFLAATSVSSVGTRTITVTTDLCTSWNVDDPCCNVFLQDRKCCAASARQAVVPNIQLNNSTLVSAVCTDPTTLSAYINNYFGAIILAADRCVSRAEQSASVAGNSATQLVQALTELVFPTNGCVNNTDCPSGVCGVDGVCQGVGFDLGDSATLGNYVLSKVDQPVYIKLALGLAANADAAAVGAAMKTQFTSNKCLNLFSFELSNTDGLDSCPTITQCVDGSTSGICSGSTGFCGAFCNDNKYFFKNFNLNPDTDLRCKGDASSVFATEAVCQTKGLCVPTFTEGIAGVSAFSLLYLLGNTKTQAECAVENVCVYGNAYIQLSDAALTTQAACTNSGYCLGHATVPAVVPTALRYTVKMPDAKQFCVNPNGVCAKLSGTPEGILDGCIVNGLAQSGCQAAGFRWVDLSSQQTCEAEQGCRENIWFFGTYLTGISKKSQEECTKCAAKSTASMVSKFKYYAGMWQPKKFLPYLKWVSAAKSSVAMYKKVAVADATLIGNFFTQRLATVAVNSFLYGLYSCAYKSKAEFVLRFACACGVDKNPSGGCFAATNPTSKLIVPLGTKHVAEIGENTQITFFANTFSSTTSVTVSVTVNVKFAISTSSSSSAETRQSSTSNGVILLSGTTGQLVNNNGYSIGQSITGPAQICIGVDPTIPRNYNFPAFAKETSNGVYEVDTSVKIASQVDTSKVCGNVTNGQAVYYAAMLGSPVSSATTAVFSWAFVMLALFQFFL